MPNARDFLNRKDELVALQDNYDLTRSNGRFFVYGAVAALAKLNF
jgi:hypothetical protein